MNDFETTSLNKVTRGAKRASYNRGTVYQILDDGMICHLSYYLEGQPLVIPTAYGRIKDTIYVHGSIKSRTLEITEENRVCLCVTLLDGLVLARSAFHHSANYRSVMVFGNARAVEQDEEKNQALFAITENILRGRWDEVRAPSQKELDVTKVLAIKIELASAKIRKGGPIDDKDDYKLEVWAGELPFNRGFSKPIKDKLSRKEVPLSPSVRLASTSSKT